MARINLLPWREELRKQYLKDFLGIIGLSVIITLAAMLGVHAHIEGMKDYQKKRNGMINKEIAKLNIVIKEIKDIEAKKNRMQEKIDTIYGLQLSRPEAVHLFEELAQTLPEGVFLTQFTQSGRSLAMSGLSQSNARISAYMREIESSTWLGNPRLDIIRGGEGAQGHSDQFNMRAKQIKPKAKNGGKS